MDAVADGEIVELPGGDARVMLAMRGRRGPAPELLLRRLVGAGAGVPADDVELVQACETCGGRHGRPRVGYPTTPSGAPWFVDAGGAGELVVAAAATRRRVGVGVEIVGAAALEAVDEAALHPSEREALADLDAPDRARARATLWARKSALLRAIGHTEFTEPSTLALTMPGDDEGVGRIARTVPEFGPGWRGIRFHDLAVPGAVVATVAVLG